MTFIKGPQLLQGGDVVFDLEIMQFVGQGQLPEQQEAPFRKINSQKAVAVQHDRLFQVFAGFADHGPGGVELREVDPASECLQTRRGWGYCLKVDP